MKWNPTNWLAAFLASFITSTNTTNLKKPAVVMVHGIFDSGSKMAWLAAWFSRAGYETFCPSLVPSNGSCSLEKLSAQLDKKISERFSNDRRLHIVGFSMGGLVTRHWLANFADRSRMVSFSTLGTPHGGTLTAYFHQGEGAKEMRPGGTFLLQLGMMDNHLLELQALSLYTPLDLMIFPSRNSHWKSAHNEKIWLPLHPLMVFSSTVASRLLREFEKQEKAGISFVIAPLRKT